MFRDGKGPNGDVPPNNWESVFGGPTWTRVTNPDGTPGQWYLHIFDSSQPDFDWENPWVREQFRGILRFWLDRGVDGFRVDVAHGMIRRPGLPDYTPPAEAGEHGRRASSSRMSPSRTRPTGAKTACTRSTATGTTCSPSTTATACLCAEAWVDTLEKTALWVRPDEMSQAFNFAYMFERLGCPRPAQRHRRVDRRIRRGRRAQDVGALEPRRRAPRVAPRAPEGAPQGAGIGPSTPGKPDPELGLRRARAATSLMLALPGSGYLYQGEELGLPEVIEMPDAARQDPTWFRTNGEQYGRDGCRVPIPWEADAPAYGFSASGKSWLPQSSDWAPFARDAQAGVAGSTLELYRTALSLRRAHALGTGAIEWLEGYDDSVVALRNGDVIVICNTGDIAVELPIGDILSVERRDHGRRIAVRRDRLDQFTALAVKNSNGSTGTPPM